MQNKTNKAALLLLFAGIIGTVYFATLAGNDIIEDRQVEAYYASLSVVVRTDDFDNNPSVKNDAANTAPKEVPGAKARTGSARNDTKSAVNKVPVVDFEAIRREVPGVIAWIRINGTVINYPVMHGTDNEYYLTRLPNGKASKSGSIFIDYRNTPDFSNANTLLHGHRMKSGTMFAALKNYSSQAFYEQHRIAFISTPEKNYELIFFAGYRLNQTVEIPPLKFKNAEDFDKYIQDIKKRSIFKSDVKVSAKDKLVTLATCEYQVNDDRLVIVGKLVESSRRQHY